MNTEAFRKPISFMLHSYQTAILFVCFSDILEKEKLREKKGQEIKKKKRETPAITQALASAQTRVVPALSDSWHLWTCKHQVLK